MQLYIDTPNTTVTVRNRCFHITNKATGRIIAPKRIDSISATANVLFNASAIKLAAVNEIPIYFFHHTGQLIAMLTGPGYLKHGRLRLAQQRFFAEEPGTQWTINNLTLKFQLQSQTLQRIGKERPGIKEELLPFVQGIRELAEKVINQNSVAMSANTLMALEGSVARHYYRAINLYLPVQYRFEKRSRRPGQDYFNSTLNYIYGMTYGHITKAVCAAGLDTFVGGLHTTPFKETLVFDCIEPFRPLMDRLLLELCNKNLLVDKHFRTVPQGYWLSKEGKKLIVPAYAEHLAKRIKLNGKVLSIENHMYHYVRYLKNAIQAQEK